MEPGIVEPGPDVVSVVAMVLVTGTLVCELLGPVNSDPLGPLGPLGPIELGALGPVDSET